MNALTLAEAAALWRGVLAHTTHTIEYVPPDKAWGRIAAADICAAHPYPPYRKSPFDGYALCLNGKERSYEVVATIGAGEHYDEPVLPGQAVRLMTGCAVPRSCQAVVMQESVRRWGNTIELTTHSPARRQYHSHRRRMPIRRSAPAPGNVPDRRGRIGCRRHGKCDDSRVQRRPGAPRHVGAGTRHGWPRTAIRPNIQLQRLSVSAAAARRRNPQRRFLPRQRRAGKTGLGNREGTEAGCRRRPDPVDRRRFRRIIRYDAPALSAI